LPLEPLAAINPAALPWLGKRYDLAVAVFNPNRQYSVSGNPSGFPGTFGLAPGTVESGTPVFAIPSFGANWMLDDDSSFGFSLYGNGGMNTDYDARTFGFSPTGVDLAQLFIAPTYARKLAEHHAVGVSGILAYQRFRVQGLQAFAPFSRDGGNLTDNEHDNSFGFRRQVWLSGGVVSPSLGGGFLPNQSQDERVRQLRRALRRTGGFDIPSNWTVGVAIKPTESAAILFDVQQIYYSEIKSVGNPLLPNLASARLGEPGGAGFGWRDMTTYKFGGQFQAGDAWTWRVGYSFGEQPIPSSEMLFNIIAPGVIEQHLTFGFSKKVGGKQEVSFALMHAFSHAVDGPNPLEAPGRQSIELKMNQWEFAFGLTF
jgi:long-chain fatty acid transport protein